MELPPDLIIYDVPSEEQPTPFVELDISELESYADWLPPVPPSLVQPPPMQVPVIPVQQFPPPMIEDLSMIHTPLWAQTSLVIPTQQVPPYTTKRKRMEPQPQTITKRTKPGDNITLLKTHFAADDPRPSFKLLRETFPHFDKKKIASLATTSRKLAKSNRHFIPVTRRERIKVLTDHFQPDDQAPTMTVLRTTFPYVDEKKIRSLYRLGMKLRRDKVYFAPASRAGRGTNIKLLKENFARTDPVPGIGILRAKFPHFNERKLNSVIRTAEKLFAENRYFTPKFDVVGSGINIRLLMDHFQRDAPVPSINVLQRTFPHLPKQRINDIFTAAMKLARQQRYFNPDLWSEIIV